MFFSSFFFPFFHVVTYVHRVPDTNVQSRWRSLMLTMIMVTLYATYSSRLRDTWGKMSTRNIGKSTSSPPHATRQQAPIEEIVIDRCRSARWPHVSSTFSGEREKRNEIRRAKRDLHRGVRSQRGRDRDRERETESERQRETDRQSDRDR